MFTNGIQCFPLFVPSDALDQNEVHDIPGLYAPTIADLEILRIDLVCAAAVSGGAVTLDIESVATDETKADIVAGFDLESLDTDTVLNVYNKKIRLAAGTGINFEFTADNNAVTDGDGYTFLIWYRVVQWRGAI